MHSKARCLRSLCPHTQSPSLVFSRHPPPSAPAVPPSLLVTTATEHSARRCVSLVSTSRFVCPSAPIPAPCALAYAATIPVVLGTALDASAPTLSTMYHPYASNTHSTHRSESPIPSARSIVNRMRVLTLQQVRDTSPNPAPRLHTPEPSAASTSSCAKSACNGPSTRVCFPRARS